MGSPAGQKPFLLLRHFLQQRQRDGLAGAAKLGDSFEHWSAAFRSAGAGAAGFSGFFEDLGILFYFVLN